MEEDRDKRIRDALMHVRNALLAGRAHAPMTPALLKAEEELMYCLFKPEDIAEYLTSPGAKVYGR